MTILKAKKKTSRRVQKWDPSEKDVLLAFLGKYRGVKWDEKCRLWEEQYGKARPRESLRGKMNYLTKYMHMRPERHKTRCRQVVPRPIDVVGTAAESPESPETQQSMVYSRDQGDKGPQHGPEVRTRHVDDGHIKALQEGNAPSNSADQTDQGNYLVRAVYICRAEYPLGFGQGWAGIMATWLRLISDTGGWVLEDSGQFKKVIKSLAHPCDQFPSLVFLLGGSTKRQALRCLLPHNNTSRQGVAGIAKVHLNTIDTDVDYPYLAIDGSLDQPGKAESCNISARAKTSVICRRRIHSDAGHSYAAVREYIFSTCILPYVHLMCIFADDLLDSEPLIRSWTAPSNLPGLSHRVVIVLTERDHEAQATKAAAHARRSNCVVTILDLCHRHELSAPARFEPLRSAIRRELELQREHRNEHGQLFSATHLEALVTKTVRHAVKHPGTGVDILAAVRESNPVPPGIRQHIHDFLSLSLDAQLPLEDTAVFIASALVMDAYPPGMHNFDPRMVFRQLYAGHCTAAWAEAGLVEAQIGKRKIESAFIHFANLLCPPRRAVQLRRKFLRSSQIWAKLKTNNTCLFCLLRGTCEVLPCRHAICETCVRRLGRRARAEHHFEIGMCPICQTSFNYTVRLLPPTQRPNILVLDGGGIRGAIGLGYLQALEEYTGLRDFHLTVSTSVGALIAIYRILRGHLAKAAWDIFETFAREVFSPANRPYTFFDFVQSLLIDGKYNSDKLDSALAKALTTDARLYDTSLPQPSGTRIAVTASHVDKKGTLCVFGNYRHLERIHDTTAYEFITPKTVNDEPSDRHVSRCAVAALGYFKPFHLPGLGTFQDGGVCANCPLRVALRESELLWPSAGRPNLIVSIGTGFEAPVRESGNIDPKSELSLCSRGPLLHETATTERREGVASKTSIPTNVRESGPARLFKVFTRGYIKRAKDVFVNSPAVDGNQGWKDARDSIPHALRDDLYRLDFPLESKLPELDDASRIGELSSLPFTIPEALSFAVQTTSFFFELDEEPVQWDHMYHCQGSILCDKSNPLAFLTKFQSKLPDAQFMVGCSERLGTVSEHDGCQQCGFYRKRVTLRVPCLDDTIQLTVISQGTMSKIGGFPTSVRDIIKNQQAGAVFGRADHSLHQWAPCRECYCTPGSKREKPSPSHISLKRPRLR